MLAFRQTENVYSIDLSTANIRYSRSSDYSTPPQVMKLDDLDNSKLQQAIDLYMKVAYQGAPIPPDVQMKAEVSTLAVGRQCFVDQRFENRSSPTIW